MRVHITITISFGEIGPTGNQQIANLQVTVPTSDHQQRFTNSRAKVDELGIDKQPILDDIKKVTTHCFKNFDLVFKSFTSGIL